LTRELADTRMSEIAQFHGTVPAADGLCRVMDQNRRQAGRPQACRQRFEDRAHEEHVVDVATAFLAATQGQIERIEGHYSINRPRRDSRSH
jgi:hypothetical protein